MLIVIVIVALALVALVAFDAGYRMAEGDLEEALLDELHRNNQSTTNQSQED